MFKSIRSRLVLSFAAIALVTAVALGIVLLAILQNYYANLELDYLRGNAQSTSGIVTEMISSELSDDEVQALIENLAFLSQTRIQVYTLNSNLLYDSGPPQNLEVDLDNMTRGLRLSNEGDPDQRLRIISIDSNRDDAHLTPSAPVSATLPAAARVVIFQTDQAVGLPFGLNLSAGVTSGGVRSNLAVTEPMLEPHSGSELGTVRLSEAPALGATILMSVAQGWTFAGALAVLLAALLGWGISQRMSAPVLALTNVTTRMAQGDLSSRANVKSRDEFGQLARSFNDMAKQVETTVTTLHRFVSDAAHELHTPLTALRADLDLAAQENDAAAQHIFVERAQTTALRLETITNNLLDLSRLEAQADQESARPLDLAALIRQSAEVYASQAEQSGLTFAVRVPDEPMQIRAYATQVQRALNNLFDNACKFTPAGGTVAIQVQRAGSHIQLSVSDTGIGIPPEDLPRLFNRFHRSRNVTEYSGSGLGLAIVKAIMEQHGGQVLVENTTPGARFTLQWVAHA